MTFKRLYYSSICATKKMLRPTLFLLLLAVLFVPGCKTVPVQTSKWSTSVKPDEPFRFFDPKSKVRYDIRNDSTNLYVRLDVIDPKTRMRILRTGCGLTFGTSSKEKQAGKLEFPLVEMNTPVEMDQTDITRIPRDNSAHELRKLLPKEGIFYSPDHNFPILPDIEQKGFLLNMVIDKQGALVYNATIPLKFLNLTTSEFNFEFQTGAFDVDNADFNNDLSRTGAEGLDRSATFGNNRDMDSDPSQMGMNPGIPGQGGFQQDPYRTPTPTVNLRSELGDAIEFKVKIKLSAAP